MLTKQILLGCLAILKLTFVDANMHGVDELDMYDSNSRGVNAKVIKVGTNIAVKAFKTNKVVTINEKKAKKIYKEGKKRAKKDKKFNCEFNTQKLLKKLESKVKGRQYEKISSIDFAQVCRTNFWRKGT